VKGRQIRYTDAELRFIETRRVMNRRELRRLFVVEFERPDVTLIHLNALCKRRGWMTGRTGQYPKGAVPLNKGKPMPFHPNSAATRFKKGERRGVAARLWKPVGTERMSKDGYLERKVNDGLPMQARWRAVHIVRWEEINGPLPKGMALKSLDGQRLNIDPSNWELVSRALLPRLNGKSGRNYDGAPSELKPTILAVAKLEHAVMTKKRRPRSRSAPNHAPEPLNG
jgi:hypothetical protein